MKFDNDKGALTAHVGMWTFSIYYPMIQCNKKDSSWGKDACVVGLWLQTTIVFRSDFYKWAVAVEVLGCGLGIGYKSDFNPYVKEASEQQPTPKGSHFEK